MRDVDLKEAFRARFGADPRSSSAPGRVNLIGEHTDYNEGWVLPVAIGLGTRVAFGPASGGGLTVVSTAFPDESVEIPLGVAPARRNHWSDYVHGVLRELEAASVTVPPAALLVDSDVPLGAGLSSSASLEVATAWALLALADHGMAPTEVALLCQRAENDFVGTRCGIMDMFISCLGREGQALLLDCRSREVSYVGIPDSTEIVIVNSGVRHSLAAGEYNRRRAQCESAVATLARANPAIGSLRDVAAGDLDRVDSLLGGVERRRARHVVTENARVQGFVTALLAGDLTTAGGLLDESHRSLRDDYEVSCPELDSLVDLAHRRPALLGARMTGGGFGGCTVNLVRAGQGRLFLDGLTSDYREQTGRALEGWITRPAPGAYVL
ncbi:MAG: galactokinase [Candidatus Binatia bacterium]|nr:galactokinase [Candidatus Binatia bacterium]